MVLHAPGIAPGEGPGASPEGRCSSPPCSQPNALAFLSRTICALTNMQVHNFKHTKPGIAGLRRPLAGSEYTWPRSRAVWGQINSRSRDSKHTNLQEHEGQQVARSGMSAISGLPVHVQVRFGNLQRLETTERRDSQESAWKPSARRVCVHQGFVCVGGEWTGPERSMRRYICNAGTVTWPIEQRLGRDCHIVMRHACASFG